MYRDVTLGPPTQGCIFQLVDSFDKTAGYVAFGVAATAVIGIVLLLFSFGLYCPEKKEGPPKRKFITYE
jgi:hypothetical protein